MQALTHGHHVDERDKSYIQPPAKPSRRENRLGTYPEVTSDEDISCEKFTHKTPSRLLMPAGWVPQDQFKQSWS